MLVPLAQCCEKYRKDINFILLTKKSFGSKISYVSTYIKSTKALDEKNEWSAKKRAGRRRGKWKF